MPDELTRGRELLSRLQESILFARERRGRKLPVTDWLDEHQADVRELCELRGNDMVEHFLGLPRGSITQWRQDRDFTEPPEVAREKDEARQRQVQASLLRLKEDQPSLQRMQPRRWLDRHQQDVEIILSSGRPILDFADLFGISDTTMRNWAKSGAVPEPLEEDRNVAGPESPQDTATNGDSWQDLSPEELRKVIAQDINTMGMKEASTLWRGRGMSPQRWGRTVGWVRRSGLLDGGPSEEEQPRSQTGGKNNEPYYRAKYEGMKEALEIIFKANPESGGSPCR